MKANNVNTIDAATASDMVFIPNINMASAAVLNSRMLHCSRTAGHSLSHRTGSRYGVQWQ